MDDVHGPKPHRAHSLVVRVGADTASDLAWELREMANKIERGEMTVGCMGGSSVGSMYSYRVQPEQTHDKYFQEIEEMLARSRAASAQ